jgi:hypothetical protein
VRVIRPDPREALTIVEAMHAVATAEGRVPLLAVEREGIDAIQRHLLHQPVPLAPARTKLPDDLAEILANADLRRETVRILAMVPIFDQQVTREKADVVFRAAATLGVDDVGLAILRRAVKRQFTRMAFGLMSRSVAYYWSPTGKARLRDWLDMLRISMPTIPGLYGMLTDRALLTKYRGLAGRPAGTLGNALYHFYVKRGYPMPGEPKSFPEGWSKHECYHLISEYETSDPGEMLNAAFSGGNTQVLCMDLLMLTLLQFHCGFRIMPGPAPKGALEPDAFFRAVARGAAMNVDLLNGWDLWTAVDLPMEELRRRFNVPELSPPERVRLAERGALIA